jgi:tryptophan 7-dimethylallyltransferase
MALISACMDCLGLIAPWNQLRDFLNTCPADHRVSPLFLAVGTVPSSDNGVKIYFRTQASSLAELTEYMTFGGRFPKEHKADVSEAVSALRLMWRLLFSDVWTTAPLSEVPSQSISHPDFWSITSYHRVMGVHSRRSISTSSTIVQMMLTSLVQSRSTIAQ